MKTFLLILIVVLAGVYIWHTYFYISTAPLTVSPDAISELQAYKIKQKFVAEGTSPGLSNPSLQPTLNDDMNLAANDFATTVNNHGSEQDYLNDITNGLTRFNSVYINLSPSDKQQIISSFQELMTIVGLKNSHGVFGQWLDDFDASKVVN